MDTSNWGWKVGDLGQPWGPECGTWRVSRVDAEMGMAIWEPLTPADLELAKGRYHSERG
jgi:hypothetical protein